MLSAARICSIDIYFFTTTPRINTDFSSISTGMGMENNNALFLLDGDQEQNEIVDSFIKI